MSGQKPAQARRWAPTVPSPTGGTSGAEPDLGALVAVPGRGRRAARSVFGVAADTPRFLAEGMLNQSWQIDTEQGRFVLRVTRPELTRNQVAYEHAVDR